MSKHILSEGEAVLVVKGKSCMIHISEGTGDNLLNEDIAQGYVDYINWDSYKLPAVDASPDASLIEDDGGMVLFTDYVSNISSEDIINAVCYQAGLEKADCLAIPCFGFDPDDPGSSFCFCNV